MHYPKMAKRTESPSACLAENLGYLKGVTPHLDTQVKIAQATGIGQSTVGRILRGEVNTSSGYLQRVADAFGVRLDALTLPPAEFAARWDAGDLRKTGEGLSFSLAEPAPVDLQTALGVVLRAMSSVSRVQWQGAAAAMGEVVGRPDQVDDALSVVLSIVDPLEKRQAAA